jgi:hypothetical protein
MIGTGLGQLTEEIIRFVSTGPKDLCMKLDTGKIVCTCKGFRTKSEAEERITMNTKIN